MVVYKWLSRGAIDPTGGFRWPTPKNGPGDWLKLYGFGKRTSKVAAMKTKSPPSSGPPGPMTETPSIKAWRLYAEVVWEKGPWARSFVLGSDQIHQGINEELWVVEASSLSPAEVYLGDGDTGEGWVARRARLVSRVAAWHEKAAAEFVDAVLDRADAHLRTTVEDLSARIGDGKPEAREFRVRVADISPGRKGDASLAATTEALTNAALALEGKNKQTDNLVGLVILRADDLHALVRISQEPISWIERAARVAKEARTPFSESAMNRVWRAERGRPNPEEFVQIMVPIFRHSAEEGHIETEWQRTWLKGRLGLSGAVAPSRI